MNVLKLQQEHYLRNIARGVMPWDGAYKRLSSQGPGALTPCNGASGNEYGGPNLISLLVACKSNGWDEPYFLSLRQAQKLGGVIPTAVEGTPVTFFDKAKQSIRYYPVWNVDQIQGLEIDQLPAHKSILVEGTRAYAKPERASVDEAPPKTIEPGCTPKDVLASFNNTDFLVGAKVDSEGRLMPMIAGVGQPGQIVAVTLHGDGQDPDQVVTTVPESGQWVVFLDRPWKQSAYTVVIDSTDQTQQKLQIDGSQLATHTTAQPGDVTGAIQTSRRSIATEAPRQFYDQLHDVYGSGERATPLEDYTFELAKTLVAHHQGHALTDNRPGVEECAEELVRGMSEFDFVKAGAHATKVASEITGQKPTIRNLHFTSDAGITESVIPAIGVMPVEMNQDSEVAVLDPPKTKRATRKKAANKPRTLGQLAKNIGPKTQRR